MTAAIEFADPRGLWALALAVPLIVLHLYRKRRLRIEIGRASCRERVCVPV